MQHFDLQNFDKIKDADAHCWATVRADDETTFSELVRREFHLVDMTGEIWTLHRAARAPAECPSGF